MSTDRAEGRKAGFINPNIFAERNLAYRIRLCSAPMLAETVSALERERAFNSYLIRGEYDIAVVSVESHHFLSRAFFDKKIEELKLEHATTLTVARFVKYHGCPVTPIRCGESQEAYPSETLHYLFIASKDWDAAPESYRLRLLDKNLLMVKANGQPYESAGRATAGRTSADRGHIVRLGFRGESRHADAAFQRHLEADVARDPAVRNCYLLMSPAPCQYVLELTGEPEAIDGFLARLHEEGARRFPGTRIVTRCDEVIRKLSDGDLNVLLTFQTRPEVLALAEQRLMGPLLFADQRAHVEMIAFLERSEPLICSIRGEALQQSCLGMLSAIQLALQLNNCSLLQSAMTSIGRQLASLMVARLATVLGCTADEEIVVGELKRRGLFKEHTATFGSLYPVFLQACGAGQPGAGDGTDERPFAEFADLCNRLMLSNRAAAESQLTASERQQAEQVFCDLIRIVPRYFLDAA